MLESSNNWTQQCALLSEPPPSLWAFEGGEVGQPLGYTSKVPVVILDQVDQMEAFLGFTAADLFAAAAGIGIRMQV